MPIKNSRIQYRLISYSHLYYTGHFPGLGFPPLYPGGREILLGEGRPIQHSFAAWQWSRPWQHGSMDESHGRCHSSASATEYYVAHPNCASLVAQLVKNLPAMWETLVWSLGWEDPPEEGMTTHSSILAWRIPMDRRAWWAAVRGVIKSQTWLSS